MDGGAVLTPYEEECSESTLSIVVLKEIGSLLNPFMRGEDGNPVRTGPLGKHPKGLAYHAKYYLVRYTDPVTREAGEACWLVVLDPRRGHWVGKALETWEQDREHGYWEVLNDKGA
ncbi:hypothetical protein A2761_00475 [Candidatus Kaiserbacteria bacterium RIFCSPHIGHO2_01_FULL_51_33]|uniref:Uncharacterized protein n=1 Tax=Candidatus Kaiserbacteria bacterium RIFCSPLOWO2_01_FULL_51_21 TaxID=1798508 RepID=A0A1F6EDI8_9BACT|nr:MAG: hypothetical protein A2761_00475 [Candidatus Kaiserbacteria bacterium RIFCSPHIGHO2_01_FULL_51_33]OGG71733.1 MAG: hypothetical protein A3A35_01900 [Candidatus Kaiserbacteria bacterium RIFCSPLOWO2_01_FULL_51_21]